MSLSYCTYLNELRMMVKSEVISQILKILNFKVHKLTNCLLCTKIKLEHL